MKLAIIATVLFVHGGLPVVTAGTGEGCQGISGVTAGAQVTLSGRLNVVQNGETRFFLIDDRGVATRLIIDESVMKPFGGSRGVDRKYVTIEGQRVDEMSDVVRVLSIALEPRAK
ncbi:MAG TPA: hypothetical protein VMS64_31890 [Candidatus Methylomirabilis sp.]|nr:hypothetical protein [Candidatus Methylomirabilis sp.]